MYGYGKNLVVVYGHVKNFDYGKIFGGALIFFFVVGIFFDMGFFVGMGMLS